MDMEQTTRAKRSGANVDPYSDQFKWYTAFTKDAAGEVWAWEASSLPPLDVLMVWHTHMLNPRVYLEDCMRLGLRELWLSGMPWRLINAVIDNQTFQYAATGEAKQRWNTLSHLHWDNIDEPPYLPVPCPFCKDVQLIPWTTCGQERPDEEQLLNGINPWEHVDLDGNGFADGRFIHWCSGPENHGAPFTQDTLSLANFVTDAKMLISSRVPMPGTILDFPSGTPLPPTRAELANQNQPLAFPNRVIDIGLRSEIPKLLSRQRASCYSAPYAGMEEVKRRIDGVMTKRDGLGEVEGAVKKSKIYLHWTARMGVRKMMSRYWGNRYGAIGIDLVDAVMRQGVFVEKMYNVRPPPSLWLLHP